MMCVAVATYLVCVAVATDLVCVAVATDRVCVWLFQSFHKSCFLCLSCNKSLNSMTVCQHDNDVYCKGTMLQHTCVCVV